MRKRVLAAALCAAALAAASPSAMAQNDAWCLVNDQKGSTSCAFVSRDQCMLSTGGNIGHCVANPGLPSPTGPARRRSAGAR